MNNFLKAIIFLFTGMNSVYMIGIKYNTVIGWMGAISLMIGIAYAIKGIFVLGEKTE